MKDETHRSPTAYPAMEAAEVTRLAQRAIAVLAAHGPGRSDGLSHRLVQLCDAFISSDEEPRHEMLQRLRQDGVSTDDIIDHVIPAVARLMGERWFADDISFAHVTIGAARLQEAVRAFGWHDDSRNRAGEDAQAILLVIPRAEHHTLGTFVLADQLRRRGYTVHIAVDRHPRQVAEMLRKRRYVMIGITASGRRTLASARELVDIIRQTVTTVTPVILGGPILDKRLDVLGLTGADHTAADADMALRKCGLLRPGREAPVKVTVNQAGDVSAGGEDRNG
ncbi:cobalamin B12-binding domain-containing protein [Roseicyclus persicicus]|uniref:Cobalamin B12-binding domain-containing protein n=1 Tax=Roseicyclus persicicus TaxID=2650661 RepID=A0A7X6GZ75_9RHOB|nr:cobalamin-dependent protein [Roseibacterium persicicum]NKX45063.1 cobalamin B12-binding domain-containing protein [Roseibacterium persicicum]